MVQLGAGVEDEGLLDFLNQAQALAQAAQQKLGKYKSSRVISELRKKNVIKNNDVLAVLALRSKVQTDFLNAVSAKIKDYFTPDFSKI